MEKPQKRETKKMIKLREKKEAKEKLIKETLVEIPPQKLDVIRTLLKVLDKPVTNENIVDKFIEFKKDSIREEKRKQKYLVKKAEKRKRDFEEAKANNEEAFKIATKKRRARVLLDDIRNKANNLALLQQLKAKMIIFNPPKEPQSVIREINSQPQLRNSLEKEIQTHYYVNLISVDDIKKRIIDLYGKQRKVFKLSLTFGFVFEKVDAKMEWDNEKDEFVENGVIYTYVVHRPSNANFYIQSALIQNRKALDTVLEKMTLDEIIKYVDSVRPSSSHSIIGVYSMGIKIMKMDKTIGAKIEIPQCVHENHNFVNLESSHNMCFWICYAYHLIKNRYCAKLAKTLFEKFHGVKPTKDYQGVDLFQDIPLIEEKDKVGFNIFEMVNSRFDENGKEIFDLEYVRKSLIEDNFINLLLIDNHFVYISRLDVFEGTKYCCETCGHCSADIKDLNKHIKSCQHFEKKDVFAKYPTIYEPDRNVIVQLNEELGTNCDFRFNPVAVYDFESLCLPNQNEKDKNLVINNEQRAVSVSLCSNIEGFTEPIFIENENVEILFNEMFNTLDSMCSVAKELMEEQFQPLLDKIESISNEKRRKQLINTVRNYMDSIPVVGFNSGKYDINLNMKEFMEQLVKRNGNKIFAIKNGNSFKSLKSGSFHFLDICQYLPPNYNLDNYIKAFNPQGLRKSVFPYEFLNSYEKLNCDIHQLTKDDFFSQLKNKGITDEEWKEFQNNKISYQWKTVRDLLKFYNNLDVQPFLEAVVNHGKFFHPLKLDMFKDGFSLPALGEKIMFSYEFKEFNESFIRQQIPECRYTEFTNWSSKKTNYILQDKEKDRYTPKDFIPYYEVQELMKTQSNKCLYCWKPLKNETWSLDRIDNDFGHNKENCVLSCIDCNTQRGDENFSRFYRKKALLRYAQTHPMIYLIDEPNKIVFEKLKKNICGGPSIVFHRYHEAGITKIKRPIYQNGKWEMGEEGKIVKNISGFDANALYLWCIGNTMPCGILEYVENDGSFNLDNFDGFVEVDIHTPEELKNKFSEFPLIFKNVEYNVNDEVEDSMIELIDKLDGKHKETRLTRKLISSYYGEKVLIKSDRLKWLVSQGLVITKVYGSIPCVFADPFKTFMEKVSEERRKGDINPDHAIIAEMWKLVGNSAFGRTGMNKSKFTKTEYGDLKKYHKSIGSILFKDANQYGDLFEITKDKRNTKQNIPIQVACSIYDDAKLLMSQFYYDCIDKFIDRADFQYVEMDTDSAYMALTDDFEKLIKPEMKEIYEEEKHKWFPRTDTKENRAFDKRRAGLFKEEFKGKGIVALSSKMYYVKGFDDKDKFSCKGIQHKNNIDTINFDNYKKIVQGEETRFDVKNKGMRIFNSQQITGEYSETKQGRGIYTYEMGKLGLNGKYDKRIVLEDGISTVPLNI